MWKSAYILFLAVAAGPLAAAEIYKCAGKSGLDLYQNFPCALDSLGWVPKDPQGQTAQSTVSSTEPERPKAAAPKAVEQGKSFVRDATPRVGMTAEEVRTIWGDPTGDAIRGLVPVWRSQTADNSVEIWTYSATRSVQFDQNGRVSVLRQ